jgi:hypothetical protein
MFTMQKILYLISAIAITITIIILSFSIRNSYVTAQSNSQGTQTGEHQGIPGPQENANPLTQAPITGLEVKPPNNTTTVPPVQKGNLTGTKQ